MKNYIVKISDLDSWNKITLFGSSIDLGLNLETSVVKNDKFIPMLENSKTITSIFEVNSNDDNELKLNKIIEVFKGISLEELEIDKFYPNIIKNGFVEIDSETVNYILSLFIEELKDRCSYINSQEDLPYSRQRIFFGAPGTGKSYSLNEQAKIFGKNYNRVTFHPNYSYGSFVGTYKPFPIVLKDEIEEFGGKKVNKEIITYKFVAGPFIKTLIKAIKEPKVNQLLIIEEINRANVAAVFGEVFQLLDRDVDGKSEYYINISEELKLYLKMELIQHLDNAKKLLGENLDRLVIPSNMYIWATMNSADQGVQPLDTAFKRRWDFEYKGINDGVTTEFENYKFMLGKQVVLWDEFRRKVNKKLVGCGVPEDKLIGPYFISKKDLESLSEKELTKKIKDKVLMYLYEDAAKHHRNKLFKKDYISTYSDLCKNFDNIGQEIFQNGLELAEKNLDNNEV
ncbi:AAA family ATPase [Clostridium perfringens]|uniref:AAA family ATPase n=1 Tax=Clostridium perfringens TaxID=1502 RepID=UPI001ABB45C2|nr:AAA family ATPase [Clostridium perfringens]MBO3360788.1 AAA family ATPase [Clostridium perfringens]MDK0843096.1 AAA family ATPase [Clostridium perfringens]